MQKRTSGQSSRAQKLQGNLQHLQRLAPRLYCSNRLRKLVRMRQSACGSEYKYR